MKHPILKGTMLAALVMPLMLPTMASAQSRAELRRDRQEIREEQRELNRARAHGTPRQVQEQRRDVREAHQEYREDWRDYRNHHRNLYRAPAFNASFRYRSFAPGTSINRDYWSPRYRVADVGRWRLPPAAHHQTYVRHYNDLLLVNTRTGRVVRVYNGFYW